MSVASQIQRIKDAVADAYTSVEEKGGTLPATENVANLAAAIESIQTGGISPETIRVESATGYLYVTTDKLTY